MICQTGSFQLWQKPRGGRGGCGRECQEISNERPISIQLHEIISYLHKEQDQNLLGPPQFYKVSDRQTYKANTRGPGGPKNDTDSFGNSDSFAVHRTSPKYMNQRKNQKISGLVHIEFSLIIANDNNANWGFTN